MSICLLRLGTGLTFYLSPSLVSAAGNSLAFAFWFGTFMMGVSLLSTGGTVLLNQFVERRTGYVPLNASGRKIQLSDLKRLPIKFWLILCMLFTYYTSFLCFVNVSVGYLIDMFHFADEKDAGQLAVFSPEVSEIVDDTHHLGNRRTLRRNRCRQVWKKNAHM